MMKKALLVTAAIVCLARLGGLDFHRLKSEWLGFIDKNARTVTGNS